MQGAPDKPRIVVLISGGGTNLQAIIDSLAKAEIDAELCAVISNRPNVKGLERAKQHSIPAHTLDHKDYDSREAFDVAMMRQIDEYQPDLVVLAGFMRILTDNFVRRYVGRMINIHPSLLPKFRGLHTHQRAIEEGETEHGVTVHFVTEELDGGPLVLQAIVPILAGDDESALAARVQVQEHIIYPLVVKWFTEGRLQYQDGVVSMDGQPLAATGVQLDTRE